MAASKGNKNAAGNSGGKSLQDRELAADVRRLALAEILAILAQSDMDDLRKQLILKLAGTVLPRLNEHTGKDGEDLFPNPIYGGTSIPKHNSDQEDIPAKQAD
jgi:hypothetical protein